MKVPLRVVVIVLLLSPLFSASSQALSQQEQIEALKKQIEEIQRQNQKQIEELQRQNQEQIEQLKRKIQDLEAGKETERREIEDLVTKKEAEEKEAWWKRLKLIGFNPDFPSYFRIRSMFFKNATFVGAVPGKDDDIFFVDSRLLISPMLKITDNLSIRAQIDVFKNIIWGGLGDASVADKFFEAPSPADSFRGALLREAIDTISGNVLSPVEEVDFFDIRSLYMVARVPIGELWVGRQPYDWGLGILANAGSMPDQDLGSIVDRFEFDTAPLALLDERWENLTFAFLIDRLSQGLSLVNGADGNGWEVGFGALYRGENLQLGGYMFLLSQNNFDISGGLTGDLDNNVNWSIYAKYAYDPFFVSFEFQDLFGKINDLEEPLPSILGNNDIDISPEDFLLAARVGYDPSPTFIDVIVAEFGWANGDDKKTPDKLEGNAIFFNNAYTVDNLLFKHIIPNIYANEGSVTNSLYLRVWSTLKLNEVLYFTPQALFAWVDERNALSLDLLTPLPEVGRFLGTEIEGTLTWKIIDHLWFDLIGSVVIAGDGLKDLFSQRAFIEGVVPSIGAARPPDAPFAFQGRFVVTLDSLIRTWTGSSSLLKRAYYY